MRMPPNAYEEDFDAYCEWMSEVENTFFEQFGE